MYENKYTKKRYYLIFAAYFLTFGVVVAFLTSFINYNIKYTDIEKQLAARAQSEVDFKRDYLLNYITQLEQTLLSIAKNDLTYKYIKTGAERDRLNLEQVFYSLAYSNRDLMQLRFINSNGVEEIRIDRDKKTPDLIKIKPEKMQDKSSRYYFKEAVEIKNNDFWHSNVDLNVEHGKIEIPLNPTFRVATPLILNNRTQGIIIANVMMSNLLDILANSHNFHIYIIDKDGEVIINPDPEQSWSRYLEKRRNVRSIFPEKASSIITNSTITESELYMFSYAELFRNNEGLKLLMLPKKEIIGKLKMNNTITALLIAAIVLLVSLPLSWIASFVPSRLQNQVLSAYDEITKYANIIDRHIATSKTDPNGKIIEVSTKFEELSGLSSNEVIGKNHSVLRHPDTSDEHYKELWSTIKSGHVWSGEMQNKRNDGTNYWIRQVVTPEIDNKGNILAFTSVSQDITDKKIIECMSITDRLTKLYNRHKLDNALEEELGRFKRYGKPSSVLIIDADHFKSVNDTYGHQVGDDVLVKLGEILKEHTRQTDFAGRWGGEEFLILTVETDAENAKLLAEKIRKIVEDTNFDPVEKVTVSIGVAEFRSDETIANLINRADKALYHSKEKGRNRVTLYKDIADS